MALLLTSSYIAFPLKVQIMALAHSSHWERLSAAFRRNVHAAACCSTETAQLQTVQLQTAQLQEPSEVYSAACKESAEAPKPQILQEQPLACTQTAPGA